ncbi:hypothetical protein M595_4100 [Lyngbya aestuarii BL J]|uniref:Uncharacterized protein n=1 Tax=Lyngbya aestuarii BL J TaxID=1348334 RepID=U7QFW2_9CYAN|nr:hypothetical protein M595_4100 [Lyngbya aestuarii BL J]
MFSVLPYFIILNLTTSAGILGRTSPFIRYFRVFSRLTDRIVLNF